MKKPWRHRGTEKNIFTLCLRVSVVSLIFFLPMITVYPDTPDWCKKLPRAEYKTLERVPVSDSWFEVYRIRPGVFAIYEPHQFQEVISYLITGQKTALLFDTGMGISRMRPVVESLSKLPVEVLNSHTHPDHVGSNYEFSKILGQKIAYTKKNSAGYSTAEVPGWAVGSNICGDLPNHFDANHYHIQAFTISETIHDHQVIDLGGRKLEILFTPGHTPDSLCLVDRANRLLFTGDTFYPGPIYLFAPETDFASYAKSVAFLATLKPELELLLPAHNVPVASPQMLIHLNAAVEQVRNGSAKFTVQDQIREYKFNGFSLLLR